MPRPLFMSLLVAGAVLAAGCGASTMPPVPDLEQTIIMSRDRVDFALARTTRARSKDEFLERMDKAAETIDAAARDLERVGTTKGYESEVDSLVEALHQLAFDVQATADQIRQPEFSDLLAGTRGLSFESWDDVNRALADLTEEGIEVAPLERH